MTKIISICASCVAVLLVARCNDEADLGALADATAAKAIREAFVAGKGEGGAAAAAGPTGTGWATLRGRFVYAGDPPPALPPYPVTKEQNICAPGGKAPPQ